HVEIGLYETGLYVASRDLVGVQLKTQLLGRPEREPHGEFSMPGYGAYCTADARWIYLLMLTDGHWLKFCEAMGLPQATDAGLATLRLRKKAREQVEDVVRHAISQHSFDDVVARLKAAGVGCTEVLPLERVLDAPQAQQAGKTRALRYRGLDFQAPEFPRLNADTDEVRTLPPAELGEHTLEVLQAAGVSAAQRDAFLASGGVQTAKPGAFGWTPVREAA
ncbi:MAG: CoA transferase, partial [Proteobacteria bacterium]|nr:CoA transferase [Pseudomonadota bacterium]